MGKLVGRHCRRGVEVVWEPRRSRSENGLKETYIEVKSGTGPRTVDNSPTYSATTVPDPDPWVSGYISYTHYGRVTGVSLWGHPTTDPVSTHQNETQTNPLTLPPPSRSSTPPPRRDSGVLMSICPQERPSVTLLVPPEVEGERGSSRVPWCFVDGRREEVGEKVRY